VRKLKHVKIGFNFKIINKSMNGNLVLQFTMKRKEKIQFWSIKFTSMNIHCKQCTFQAFIHILETFVGHNSYLIHLLKTSSFFNFIFSQHGAWNIA
jgi:hypothetical protein